MKIKIKDESAKPIYYKNLEEMNKPLHELMNSLRSDLSNIRGKLHDIKKIYGWNDRIEHLEGGLTCMLAAMYDTYQEWEKFEKK